MITLLSSGIHFIEVLDGQGKEKVRAAKDTGTALLAARISEFCGTGHSFVFHRPIVQIGTSSVIHKTFFFKIYVQKQQELCPAYC